MAYVEVRLKEQLKRLRVVFNDRPDTASLIGREWIAEFNLFTVHQATFQVDKPKVAPRTPSNLENLFDKFKDLFENSNLLPIKGFRAHLHVRHDAQYKNFKPRPVPYALRSKNETELERLESLTIISKVSAAEFSTTPIVPVLKPNKQVRICGDFKVTVNRYVDLTQYPIPHIEELFKRLLGGAVYSKLDLPDAYHQVELDEESKRHVVITTHKGLYRNNRLCFNIVSALAIFQGISEQILQAVKGVQPYFDDIALKGKNNRDHIQILRHIFYIL